MAGVMGGLATAVSDATEHVFLECAFLHLIDFGKATRLWSAH